MIGITDPIIDICPKCRTLVSYREYHKCGITEAIPRVVITQAEYDSLKAENARLREALAKYPEWVTTLRFENNVGQTIGVCLSCGNEKVKDSGKHKPDCLRQSAEVKHER